MPDLDVADPESAFGRGDAILVSVRPPDGPAITAVLRARGYVVSEAPLGLLAARALSEQPRVLILDVDQPGAIGAAERLRVIEAGVELICVGDPGRAAELGISKSDGRAFERPIDLDAVAVAVVALAEPAPRGPGARTAPPMRDRATSPPQRMDSEAPPMSEYPSTSDPLDVAALLPSFDDAASSVRMLPAELSPELSQILAAAEQRVGPLRQSSPSSMPHPPSVPSPDEELDLLVPPDLLAALDEPLDPEDDGTGSGASTSGTAAPQAGTQRATTGTTATRTGATSHASQPSARAEATVTTAARAPSAPMDLGFGGEEAQPRWAEEAPQDQPFSMSGPDAAPHTTAMPMMPVMPVIPAIAARAGPPEHASRAGAVAGAHVNPPTHAPPTLARPPDAPPAPDSSDRVYAPIVVEGDALRILARAIAGRATGSLALGTESSLRRIVLRDGDVVTAGSGAPDETLIAFLTARGDLERDVGGRLAGKLPPFGRHAGAALIAHGHLGQDDLWPVLRSHAEWIIGRAILTDTGGAELEAEPPGRLKAEPAVFGGATGAEVLVEAVRRVVPPEVALRRLGGLRARIAEGPRAGLLGECALRADEHERVRSAPGRSVGELVEGADPELADVLYALVLLGVLDALSPAVPAEPDRALADPLDEEALRQRVRARVALVEDGDYFSLLGVSRAATGYEVRRAYLELRRAFEPSRVLTAATADLAADVRTVVEVLDEAYEILREPHRRERYRKAIEEGPPA